MFESNYISEECLVWCQTQINQYESVLNLNPLKIIVLSSICLFGYLLIHNLEKYSHFAELFVQMSLYLQVGYLIVRLWM